MADENLSICYTIKSKYVIQKNEYYIYFLNLMTLNRLLMEHFLKHGAEFPYSSAAEYLRGANRVIKDQNALHKAEAEDGDDVYYLAAANEIVFVSTDGYIRTYFKPNDGIDYFNRT